MTDIKIDTGMKIEADPETGAIARSQIYDDQPSQSVEKQEQDTSSNSLSDPRKEIMDKIYANRNEQYKRELEYAAQISHGATMETETPSVEPEPEPIPGPKVEIVSKEPEIVLPVKKTININGQQYELTQEEIEQLAQKALYNQQPQQPQYQPQQIQQTQVEPDKNNINIDTVKGIARKMLYGSEDESAAALAEFANLTVSLSKQNVPAPDQIVQAAAQRAVAQVQFQNNLEAISSEYADVFKSRAKTLVAADKVGSLRQKYMAIGLPKSDLELYREACRETRDEFQPVTETARESDKTQPVVQQTVTTANVSQSRVERKRAAPTTTQAVNKVQPMQKQSSYPTGSSIVEAMRKARGQSSMS